MGKGNTERCSTPLFKRKDIVLDSAERVVPNESISEQGITVLVINASHMMAKEITLQLQLQIPGCSIMYAPTIELAKFLLARRSIDLIVASSLLPDGSVERLQPVLEDIESPPDLVVVGNFKAGTAPMLDESLYEFAAIRRLGSAEDRHVESEQLSLINQNDESQDSISDLGADLRNDLNNPLQEIVAMVFVAQATGSGPTTQALEAIDRAAKNMAEVVNHLEDKIREAVKPL